MKMLERVFPRGRDAWWRENVEVLLVAAIVAMGVRTFFLQPFKIPTGSMQPTLYGIHPDPKCDPSTSLLWRQVELLLFGKTYTAGGCQVRGDFIFVDKMTYHFCQPRRGDVVVFETTNIEGMHGQARGKFYIKRLIALGNDEVRIDPPYVRIHGEILNNRPAFQRIYSCRDGYNGYVNLPPRSQVPAHLSSPDVPYTVPAKHFFVLGDNTLSSFDGRYWGSVPDENLVGRAILVYWPFSRRFGPVQ